MTLRRAAAIAAGLAMATSFGLAGAGMASAAAPALKIKPGATWTFESSARGCEHDVFHSSGVFVADNGGSGTWTGGGSTISMDWEAGNNIGMTFSGHFVSTTTPVEYSGPLGGIGAGYNGKLVKGAVRSFHGETC